MFRKRYNTNRFAAAARRLGSPWNRFSANRSGRADGRLEIYGAYTPGKGFEQESQWVLKQQQRATDIQTAADRRIADWVRSLQTDKERHGRELVAVDEKIRTILTQSQNMHSKVPRTNHRAKVIFFILMFVFEFSFSAVALITSGLVSIGFELAIAVVAAGVLVWLSDIVGTHIRQLPLSHEAGTTDRVRHWSIIIFSCLGLSAILAGVNFLRSLTNTGIPGDNTRQVVQWALFAIGLGLVLTGIFRSGEDEYSGPRYGLAQRERERGKLQREIAFCESTQARLNGFPAHLEALLRINLQKVIAVYADQYRRQALQRQRSIHRA